MRPNFILRIVILILNKYKIIVIGEDVNLVF